MFRSAAVTDPIIGNRVSTEDTQWIEQTRKHASNLLEKLDIDLKNYKSNSIKESIRFVVDITVVFSVLLILAQRVCCIFSQIN